MNLEALNCGVVAGIMKRANPDVNMVSAPVVARKKASRSAPPTRTNPARLTAMSKSPWSRTSANARLRAPCSRRQAALYPDQRHHHRRRRSVQHMLYTTNEDVPGIIGALGQHMGENDVNIANFTLGRSTAKGRGDCPALRRRSGARSGHRKAA